MRRTVCRVSRPSLSNFLLLPLISPPTSFLLSLPLILLSLHRPLPHYQSWPNADLNPLTSQLHYPLQPFLHTHPRKRGSRTPSQPPQPTHPKAQSFNLPQYRPPQKNLCHTPLIVYDFIFNQMCRFLNPSGGKQWSFGWGGAWIIRRPFLLLSRRPNWKWRKSVPRRVWPSGGIIWCFVLFLIPKCHFWCHQCW